MNRQMDSRSRRQTLVSIAILFILILIGGNIFFVQFQFNPAVLQKDAFSAKPNPGQLSSELSPHAAFAPLPEGIQPLTAAQMFDARNLSDKIDGKAELYLSAGFTRLVAQRFKDERRADMWMEAFVYDMGNSQNAFSVFSAQRREDAEPLGLTENAYRTPNALFLTHGRYYVEIIASKVSEQVQATCKTDGRDIYSQHP
jgi:hypothetical protein